MNIVFISFTDFGGSSEKILFALGNELVRQGNEVLVLLNGDPDTVRLMGRKCLFQIERLSFSGPFLSQPIVKKVKEFRPHVLHAWTPRNLQIRAGLEMKWRTGAKFVVHHEDDEDALVSVFKSSLRYRMLYYCALVGGTLFYPPLWKYQNCILNYFADRLVDARDALSVPLQQHLEAKHKREINLIYPVIDLEGFSPKVAGSRLRSKYGLSDDKVVMFNGGVWYAILPDFEILLRAIKTISGRHGNVKLVHTGHISKRAGPLINDMVEKLELTRHVRFLGYISDNSELPEHIAMADVLVQPGRNTDFNRLRLPSKLCSYMAMGKPIVSFSIGFGEQLVEGKEVLKTFTEQPEELAEKITLLLEDNALARRLGEGARKRAEELFDVTKNTRDLVRIYEAISERIS